MKPGNSFLAFALATGLAGNLQAATATFPPFIDLDNPSAQIGDPTFTGTPGQATATAIVLVGGGTLTGTDGTRCLVFPDPGFSCDGPAAPVGFTADLSYGGLTATGSANAGNDHAGTSLQVSSSGTSIPAFEFIQFNLISTDRQRLRFDVEGDDVPDFLEIDMNFSVYAELIDRSAIATGIPYLPQTSANIRLLEAAALPPGATGPYFAPFAADAFRTSAGITDGVDLLQTLMLKPNVEYWLLLESQSVLSLTTPPGSGFLDTRDYAGLDVEMQAWTDPTFALSADFAANNPDIAAAFTVNRIAVVPLPAALPLLLSALVAAGLLRRQQAGRTAG
jgi:hypothetical protein